MDEAFVKTYIIGNQVNRAHLCVTGESTRLAHYHYQATDLMVQVTYRIHRRLSYNGRLTWRTPQFLMMNREDI
jgi:hypothetical protein